MIFVRPTDSDSIARLVERASSAEPTYAETAATLSDKHPLGYRHDHHEVVLGRGAETFDRAVQGFQMWRTHRVPGIRVLPEGTEVRPGATVVVTVGTPPQCDRRSLPGHRYRRRARAMGIRVRHAPRASRRRRGSVHRQHFGRWNRCLRDHRILPTRQVPYADIRTRRAGGPASGHARVHPIDAALRR